MNKKPDCPYCGQPMYELKIFDGLQEQIVFTCACDEYIDEEIKESIEDGRY